MNFRFDLFFSMFKELVPFVKDTLFLAVVSFILAIVLALVLALIVEYKVPVLYALAKIYISFFRSTPMLAQLFFFYFGFVQFVFFLKDMSPVTALIIVMGMNEASFMAETIRGALSSVDKGQREAALVIGMTELQMMRRIVIPQAFRVALPGLSNSFIGMIKGTSLGFTIGVVELMSQSKLIAARNYRVMEAYMCALVIYWFVVAVLSKGQKKLEEKVNKGY